MVVRDDRVQGSSEAFCLLEAVPVLLVTLCACSVLAVSFMMSAAMKF